MSGYIIWPVTAVPRCCEDAGVGGCLKHTALAEQQEAPSLAPSPSSEGSHYHDLLERICTCTSVLAEPSYKW